MGMLEFDEVVLEGGDELDDDLDVLVLDWLLIGECEFVGEVEQEGVDVVDHGSVDMAALIVVEDEIVERVVLAGLQLLMHFAI